MQSSPAKVQSAPSLAAALEKAACGPQVKAAIARGDVAQHQEPTPAPVAPRPAVPRPR